VFVCVSVRVCVYSTRGVQAPHKRMFAYMSVCKCVDKRACVVRLIVCFESVCEQTRDENAASARARVWTDHTRVRVICWQRVCAHF
jgi:hypothetical protein